MVVVLTACLLASACGASDSSLPTFDEPAFRSRFELMVRAPAAIAFPIVGKLPTELQRSSDLVRAVYFPVDSQRRPLPARRFPMTSTPQHERTIPA